MNIIALLNIIYFPVTLFLFLLFFLRSACVTKKLMANRQFNCKKRCTQAKILPKFLLFIITKINDINFINYTICLINKYILQLQDILFLDISV